MNRKVLAELLTASDPFLVTATQALIANDGPERLLAIRRLFELRAMPVSHLGPSDRALRLMATGVLYLVIEEGEHRSAAKRGSVGSPTAHRGAPADSNKARRRKVACPPRNVRTELRLLLGVAGMCRATPAAASDDGDNVARVDLQHPGRALFMAFVDDVRAWRADPLFRDELDDLLTEPAERGQRLRGTQSLN